jgi:hypothetical protein
MPWTGAAPPMPAPAWPRVVPPVLPVPASPAPELPPSADSPPAPRPAVPPVPALCAPAAPAAPAVAGLCPPVEPPAGLCPPLPDTSGGLPAAGRSRTRPAHRITKPAKEGASKCELSSSRTQESTRAAASRQFFADNDDQRGGCARAGSPSVSRRFGCVRGYQSPSFSSTPRRLTMFL